MLDSADIGANQSRLQCSSELRDPDGLGLSGLAHQHPCPTDNVFQIFDAPVHVNLKHVAVVQQSIINQPRQEALIMVSSHGKATGKQAYCWIDCFRCEVSNFLQLQIARPPSYYFRFIPFAVRSRDSNEEAEAIRLVPKQPAIYAPAIPADGPTDIFLPEL